MFYVFLLTRRPTRPAGDAAGAAHKLVVFYNVAACCRSPRSIEAASGAGEAQR